MKRFLQLLFAATLLCGCEGFDFEGDNAASGLKFLDGTEVVPVFSAEGGSATVVFSSEYDWSISASDKWILFSPSSGAAGEAKLLITLTENTLNAERTGTVTITLSNGTTGDITLRQQPFEAPFNQILYTTSDGNIIKPGYEDYYGENVVDDADVFGANIVSNTYENGQGKILFDGDVTAIGELAFIDCHNLTSMIIPNSVTSIKDNAFFGCLNLADFIIPDSVTEIKWCAFRFCSSLTSIVIPDSVTSMQPGVFAGCTNLERFEGAFASADNRCLIGGDKVMFAFAPAGLTEYTIPDGVKEIWHYTFEDCDKLTNITIPAGVTLIRESAFSNCSSLTNMVIPDGVTELGHYAFANCSSLTNIVIPDSVTEIGTRAFANCSSLTNIVIPDSVTEIGTGAFAYCSSLTSITIPAGVTTIGGGVFAGCTNLERFEGKFASADNRCLISDGTLISIAPAGLTQYTIPDGVTIIGNNAFGGCSSLTSITIPDSVTIIGEGAFSNCDSLPSIVIPDGVTSIENSTFQDCDSLVDITIPDSVTVIGEWAFSDCDSLASITIPENVTSIGLAAFYTCINLQEVYCKPATPPAIGEYAFLGFDSIESCPDRKIYVPRASVSAYKSAQDWSIYDQLNWIVGYDF